MFFDLILLNRQHEGRFYFAWTAATRGIKYVAKNNILKTDIGKLCDDIAKYVCSESDSPRGRFSLRLSTILVNGTLKIFRQQTIYTLEEVTAFLCRVTAPVRVEDPQVQVQVSGLFATPPMPVPKAKGKKRRAPVEKETETPQSELDKVEAQISRDYETSQRRDSAILQARAGEITLREEQPLMQEGVPEGELGVLTEEELAQFQDMGIAPLPRPQIEPPREIEEIPVGPVPVIPPPGPPTMTVEAEVHAPASGEIPKKLPERRPRKRVPPPKPMEIEEDIIAVAPEEERPAPPREEPMEVVGEAPPERVLREIQNGALEERVKASPVHVRRPRKKELNKMIIDMQPVRNPRIDRCKSDVVELVPITDRRPLPKFTLVAPNLTNLMNTYVIRDLSLDAQRGRRSDLSSLRDSESLRRRSGRITPIEVSDEEATMTRTIIPPAVLEEQVPEDQVLAEQALEEPRALPVEPVPLAVMTPTPMPLVSSTPVVEKTTEEIVAVAAEEAIFSPRKKRRLLDVEPEVIRDFEELSLEPVSVPVITTKGRHQEIINKLVRSESGRLTLEEVCPEPHNKLNIARTFNDLLVLCRYKYVKLIPEDEETNPALKYIEKGPKMLRH